MPAEARYSLLVSDTVKVGRETASVLTEGITRLKDVVMELDVSGAPADLAGPLWQDEEEPEPAVKPAKKSNGDVKPNVKPKSPVKSRASTSAAAGGRVLPSKTRGGHRDQVEQTTGEKIKANQQRLHAQRQADGLKKWEHGEGGNANGQDKAVKRFESYRREEQLPREVEQRRVRRLKNAHRASADQQICVDEQKQTVLIPIYGSIVPFHISTIKNVTKTEEGDKIVLRINFQSPGQIAGKKEDMVGRSSGLQ